MIGFWAGEWSECISSPSGATTLQPDIWSLLRSGLWRELIAYLVLGIVLGWAAWMLDLGQPGNSS